MGQNSPKGEVDTLGGCCILTVESPGNRFPGDSTVKLVFPSPRKRELSYEEGAGGRSLPHFPSPRW